MIIACDFNTSNCSLLQYFLSRHTYNIDLTSEQLPLAIFRKFAYFASVPDHNLLQYYSLY